MKFRFLPGLLAMLLLSAAHAEAQRPSEAKPAAQAPQPPAQGPQPAADAAPKFVVAPMLPGAVGSEVFPAFSRWAVPRLDTAAPGQTGGDEFVARDGPPLKLVTAAEETGAAPQPVAEARGAPLRVGPNANYQGVHVAITVLEADGKHLGARPLSQGFTNGERFKVRVLATFDGDLKIDNINPKWERKQIFPADPALRVRLEAGKEALIPAGKDEFFEFTGAAGEERLVVTVRHPMATERTMSRARVYRKNEDYGSNFIQEVSFDSYPVISESIRLRHF